ncbi:MAG: hypothetical protein K8S99_18330 [Planctomycetes bacterium]|nr:hypothetical protein [Planctomycetota bacterium]
MDTANATPIGNRLELFVDDALIDSIADKASLRLHAPTMREASLTMDRPWEGNMCGGYKTYFRDGGVFRMYYQAWHGVLAEVDGKMTLKDAPIRICHAESDDGIHWRRPSLGLFEYEGSKDNNITFMGFGPEKIGIHGFAPFKDSNPACTPEARYKAFGASDVWPYKLYALQSPDGLRWSLLRDEPIITVGAFDSQNLAFWDTTRGEYRAYIRDFSGDWFRGIKTCTSPDFVQWTESRWLEYPGAPAEQLYTNQVMPYPRAPHLFIGFPTRYVERPWSPAIEALPELEHRRLRARAHERYGAAVTDGLFMASRDGLSFKRWDEAFIRPGLRPQGSWAYGDCYQGWGLLETASDIAGAPSELSMYASEGYWRGAANTIRRYTLRTDGFVSLHAPIGGGELTTRPMTFTGDRLLLNISTSAAGSARAELQSPDGKPIEGFTLDDCTEIIGDDLAFPVRWRGGGVGALEGRAVRLRFVIRDADLYSFRFADTAR